MQDTAEKKKLSRRAFFKHTTGAAACAVAATALLPTIKEVGTPVVEESGVRAESRRSFSGLREGVQW